MSVNRESRKWLTLLDHDLQASIEYAAEAAYLLDRYHVVQMLADNLARESWLVLFYLAELDAL